MQLQILRPHNIIALLDNASFHKTKDAKKLLIDLLNRNLAMKPILIRKFLEKYRNSGNISNFKIIIILISIYLKREFLFYKI